nr:hypothetical protein [Tanacetum cinerariifolium]
NSPEYRDTAGSKGKKVMNALSFYKMETDKVSERYIAPCFVNGLEVYDGEINLTFYENLISNEYAMKLCLDYEVKKGKKLIKKELIVALKGELYFVKFIINPEDDVGVILGRSFMRLARGIVNFKRQGGFRWKDHKTRKGSSKRNKDEALKEKDDPEAFIFPIRLEGKDIPIDHDAPIVVGRGFLYTIGSILNTSKKLFLTFDKVCHQTFRATRFNVLRTAKSDSDDDEEYLIKRYKFGAPIYGPKLAPYLNCNNLADRSLALQAVTNPFWKIIVWKKATMGTDNDEAGSLRSKRCRQHKIVDEVLLTMIFCYGKFARRLGLYQAAELDEEGFNVYFEGGLHSDEHFNAHEYSLSISREENLNLSRSHASTIKYPVLRVIHKMITYGFCQRMTGYDKIQKNDLLLLSMFHAKHKNGYANVAWLIARKSRVMTEDVLRSLIALIYCKDLDTTTLRELIDSESRLIPEDPQPSVPRVGIPRPPRASMQDLYDRMGRMKIH